MTSPTKIIDDGVIATILNLPPSVSLMPCFAEARNELQKAAQGQGSTCPQCVASAREAAARASRLTKDCLRCSSPEALSQIKQALGTTTLTLVYVSAADPTLSSQFVI